jgi:AAA domain
MSPDISCGPHADPDDRLPVVRAAALDDACGAARWLVEGLWARAGVGILGGAPKCCKSWLALDLALSVASATRCLDTFEVHDPGPTMLYMAEDAAAVVKARLLGLCRHRRLALDALPLDVITSPSLRIDQQRDQARLAQTVRHASPRLLVLDPFVRLHRIDENDAGQVAAVLGYLRALQRDLDVAVLVVHHARKNGQSGAQAGQSLRGSGDLHAWGDSNLYLRRQKDALTLTIEHRAAAVPEPLALRLIAGEGCDDTHLALADRAGVDRDLGGRDLDQAIVSALADATEPLGRTALRAVLRVRNERVGEALARLADQGTVVRVGERWAIPIPASMHARERNATA